jgi:hypothetical protein
MAIGTTTRPTLTPEKNGLLRRSLQVDAVVALALGLVFILAAEWLSTFTGINATTALMIAGVVSLLYGAWIYYGLRRDSIAQSLAITVIALNVAWVLGSALLVFTDWLPLTVEGKWTIVAAADVALLLAAAEIIGLRRARSSQA